MKTRFKILLGIVGVIAAYAWVFFMNNRSDLEFRQKREHVQVDSIKQSITIPTIKNTIEFNDPIVIETKEYVYLQNPTDSRLRDLVKKLELDLGRKADSLDILKKLYSQSLIRNYEDRYEDSVVSITAKSKVRGQLLRSKIDYTIKERKKEYYQTNTTVTRYVDDSFTLYGGATYSNDKLYGTISIRTKDRTLWQFGYGGGDNYTVGVQLPILPKRKKSRKPPNNP